MNYTAHGASNFLSSRWQNGVFQREALLPELPHPSCKTVPCLTLIYCGQPLSTHGAMRPRGRHEPSKPAVQGDLGVNYCRFHNYHTPRWHQLNDRMHCQRLKYYKFTYGRTYFAPFLGPLSIACYYYWLQLFLQCLTQALC